MEQEQFGKEFIISFDKYLTIMGLERHYQMLKLMTKDILSSIDSLDDTMINKEIYKIFISACDGLDEMLDRIDLDRIERERKDIEEIAKGISRSIGDKGSKKNQLFVWSQDIYNIINDYIIATKSSNKKGVNFSVDKFWEYHGEKLEYILDGDLNIDERRIARLLYDERFKKGNLILLFEMLVPISSIKEIGKIKLFLRLAYIKYYSNEFNSPIIRRLCELDSTLI